MTSCTSVAVDHPGRETEEPRTFLQLFDLGVSRTSSRSFLTITDDVGWCFTCPRPGQVRVRLYIVWYEVRFKQNPILSSRRFRSFKSKSNIIIIATFRIDIYIEHTVLSVLWWARLIITTIRFISDDKSRDPDWRPGPPPPPQVSTTDTTFHN